MADVVMPVPSTYVPPKRRPEWCYRLGRRLHPESVTDAWYAAGCPKRLDARAAGVPFVGRLRWRVAKFLRGCRA